jgi:hypothetical protein
LVGRFLVDFRVRGIRKIPKTKTNLPVPYSIHCTGAHTNLETRPHIVVHDGYCHNSNDIHFSNPPRASISEKEDFAHLNSWFHSTHFPPPRLFFLSTFCFQTFFCVLRVLHLAVAGGTQHTIAMAHLPQLPSPSPLVFDDSIAPPSKATAFSGTNCDNPVNSDL